MNTTTKNQTFSLSVQRQLFICIHVNENIRFSNHIVNKIQKHGKGERRTFSRIQKMTNKKHEKRKKTHGRAKSNY